MSTLDLGQQLAFFTREVKLVSEPNAEAFTEHVNDLLKDGWMINGAVVAANNVYSILMILPDAKFGETVNRVLNLALEAMDEMSM